MTWYREDWFGCDFDCFWLLVDFLYACRSCCCCCCCNCSWCLVLGDEDDAVGFSPIDTSDMAENDGFIPSGLLGELTELSASDGRPNAKRRSRNNVCAWFCRSNAYGDANRSLVGEEISPRCISSFLPPSKGFVDAEGSRGTCKYEDNRLSLAFAWILPFPGLSLPGDVTAPALRLVKSAWMKNSGRTWFGWSRTYSSLSQPQQQI